MEIQNKIFGSIYKITNVINNKIYIGQTTNLIKERWKGHIKCAKYKKNNNGHLYNSIRKYGKNNFKIELVEECFTSQELDNREKFWISYYDSCHNKNGYNAREGGDQPRLNEEAKRKMSLAHMGQKAWNKGIPRSKEVKRKISNNLKGRYSGNKNPFYSKKHSEDTKEKIKKARAKQKNINSKLNHNQVLKIKNMILEGISVKYISIQYSVCDNTIRHIKNNKTWKYVPWPNTN